MDFINGILNLIYPEICMACGGSIGAGEKYVCLDCSIHLPKTDFHKHRGNPAEQIFWGRFPLERASSFFYFQKTGGVQHILHHIKYRDGKQLAKTVGQWYGYDLKIVKEYNSIDCIVPVPLHKSKLIARGYNQSEWFALGLSAEMNIPVENNNLTRVMKSETQTRKTRYKRWENVSEIFEVQRPDYFKDKHIMLVDDVVTTGATLESCAQKILALNCGTKISIATIAFAR